MAVIKMIPRSGKDKPSYLKRALDYITNPLKTEYDGVQYVHSWNCDNHPDTAYAYMRMTQRVYGQSDAKQLYVHFVQSFPADQRIDIKKAHRIGIKLIDELKPMFNGFEIVMGTHSDTDVLHNHFILNRTNSETGKRWHQSRDDLKKLKEKSIELCQKNHIRLQWINHETYDVISTKERGEYESIQKGISWKEEMYKTVEYALSKTKNRWDFMLKLQNFGYGVNWWEDKNYITLMHPNGFKCRSTTLNKEWTKEYLNTYILNQGEGAYKSDFGAKKALSKETAKMRSVVNAAIHTAISREDFIHILTNEGYIVNWSDRRKNITISKDGKTNRLSTLMQTEWTKDDLLTQFQRNTEKGSNTEEQKVIQVKSEAKDAKQSEMDDFNDLFIFDRDFDRLCSCFNYAAKISDSFHSLAVNLYSMDVLLLKKENNVFVKGKTGQSEIALEDIPYLKKQNNVKWSASRLNDILDRNAFYYAKHSVRKASVSAAFQRIAQTARSLRQSFDDYNQNHAGEKLEGQALKELAISLSASEMMYWTDKGPEY